MTLLTTRKSGFQAAWDFIGFPLRAFLDESFQEKLHLTPMKEERFAAAMLELDGRALDIGCGDNELIRSYRELGGDGLGVDVVETAEIDLKIDKVSQLPFENEEFDTVVMIASLNHIPRDERNGLMNELRRVLKGGGKVVVTMLGPLVGLVRHKMAYWDIDQKRRDIDFEKEDYGLDTGYLRNLFENHDFVLEKKRRFVYGLNSIFVFRKR